MALERIQIVLVRPREAQNVGAVARAMKNMGLVRLVLVDVPALDAARAATLAVHAGDVLTARREVATLAEALAGCGLVVGTSGRSTAARDGGAAPRALAPSILAATTANDVALVFGPEDHGLAVKSGRSSVTPCAGVPLVTFAGRLNGGYREGASGRRARSCQSGCRTAILGTPLCGLGTPCAARSAGRKIVRGESSAPAAANR